MRERWKIGHTNNGMPKRKCDSEVENKGKKYEANAGEN